MGQSRREVMLAGVGILSFMASGAANAQSLEIATAALEDTLGDDAKFEQLLFNVNTLRSILVVLVAPPLPETVPYAQLASADEFQTIVQAVRGSREKVLAGLKQEPTPVEFSEVIGQALERTTAALIEGGIRPESQLASTLMGSLRTFMALTSKSDLKVESWYCGIFPFNRFCS
jgi:hypothetical protein